MECTNCGGKLDSGYNCTFCGQSNQPVRTLTGDKVETQDAPASQLKRIVSVLPDDKETEEWFNINIDGDSASSAIYKFRLWLKEREKAH